MSPPPVEVVTDETTVDFLMDQFHSVLGQRLIVEEATPPTMPMTTTGPRRAAPPRSPRILPPLLPAPPLPPLQAVPTVLTGPPPNMPPPPPGRGPLRGDETIRTGPPVHMTPPPRLVFGARARINSPAMLPLLGPEIGAPQDYIRTLVARPRAWPAVQAPASAPGGEPAITRQLALRPRPADRARRPWPGVDTTQNAASPGLARSPGADEHEVPLPCHRTGAAPQVDRSHPYVSFEITRDDPTGSRRPRPWPRLLAGVGLALAILALSGCTACLLLGLLG